MAVPSAPTGLSGTPGNAELLAKWDTPTDTSITKCQYRHKPNQLGLPGWSSWYDIPDSGHGEDSEDEFVITNSIYNSKNYSIRIRSFNTDGPSLKAQVNSIGQTSLLIDPFYPDVEWAVTPPAVTGTQSVPVVASVGTKEGDNTLGVSVPLPSAQIDDLFLILAQWTTREGAPLTDDLATPTGWTKIGFASSGSNSGVAISAYWALETEGGLSDPSLAWTSGIVDVGATTLAVRGVDPAAPINSFEVAGSGNVNTGVANGARTETTVADTLIVGTCIWDDNDQNQSTLTSHPQFRGTLQSFLQHAGGGGASGAGNGYTAGVTVYGGPSAPGGGRSTFIRWVNSATNEAAQTMAIALAPLPLVLSSDSTLSSVTSGVSELDVFNFDSDTLEYDYSVANNIGGIRVTPTATDGAYITVNGIENASGALSAPISLTEGDDTTITIVATSEDASDTTTYTFTITRAKSSVSTLASLVPSSGTLMPTFASGTLEYFLGAPGSSASFTVTGTSSFSTITVDGVAVDNGGQSGATALNPGSAVYVDIVCTSADETSTTTYRVLALMEGDPSNNNYLMDLTGAGLTLQPDFSVTQTVYEASVPSATAVTNVTPTTIQGDATVTVDGNAVVSGSPSASISLVDNTRNRIFVEVTAENGATRPYIVYVTRGMVPPAVVDPTGLRRTLKRGLKRSV